MSYFKFSIHENGDIFSITEENYITKYVHPHFRFYYVLYSS
jgi:hypothetical protein